jgi:hypothetical protein
VPAVDKHTLAHPFAELLIRECNVVRHVGPFDGVPQGLRKGTLELVFELIAATEEQRLTVQKVEELRGVQITPKHILVGEAFAKSGVSRDEQDGTRHV